MTTIPLRQFARFSATSGLERIKIARACKSTQDLTAPSFYDPLRAVIVEMHRKQLGLAHVETFVAARADERTRACYPQVVEGYRLMLKDHPDCRWFDPPRGSFPLGPLEIEIAPDLGLVINGVHHLVLLHLESAPISKRYIETALNILGHSPIGHAAPGFALALLHAPNACLHVLKAPSPRMKLLLGAEACALSAILTGL